MKTHALAVSLALVLALAAAPTPAGRAGEAAAQPSAGEAARKAIEDIQSDISSARLSWWKGNADPAVKFVGTYTGLGSDAVTLLTLNELESVWPAWKGVSKGLDRFGVAFTIYTCVSCAADGRNDLALLTALKDFLKFKLSKVSNAGAIYAAGAGIVDYSLNCLGEAAVSQVNEDFYAAYRGYQMRTRGLRSYTELIRTGGYDAVNKALDTFWDDPATHGIRGFGLLMSQDPEHRANFRMKFIRQELLTFLAMWAEREADKARIDALIQAERLIEEINRTTVVLEARILEEGLGDGAQGYRAEATFKDKAIASADVANGQLKLSFPLNAILDDRHHLARSVKVTLARPGDELNRPRDLWLPLADSSRSVQRTAAAGTIAFKATKPVYVRTKCSVEVTVGGPEAGKVSYVSLTGLSGSRESLGSSGRSGSGGSAKISGGKGSATVSAGRYLLEWNNQAQGPFTVRSSTTLNFETRTPSSADAAAAPAADLESHAAKLSAMAGRIRGGNDWRGKIYEELAESCESYRVAARTYEAQCRRAMEGWYQKSQEASRDASLKSEQKSAIQQECSARRDEIYKTMDAALKADNDRMNKAHQELRAAEKERNDKRAECSKKLTEASNRLNELVRELDKSSRAAADGFETISRPVTHGYMDYMPMDKVEEEAAKVRAALAQVEAALPAALALHDQLPAALDAYRKALSEMEDASRYQNEEVRVDRYLLDRADTLADRADALRKSDLGAKAREFLARCEKRIERRKERAKRTAEAIRNVEAAAGQLPANPGAELGAPAAELRTRADRLYAAFEKSADDYPQWQKLSQDLDRLVSDKKALLGDLLEGQEFSETACSRFRDTVDGTLFLVSYGDLPQDWWTRLGTIGWSKIEARNQAARPLLALRADVHRVLALGKTKAECQQALRAALDALKKQLDTKASGAERSLAVIQEAGETLDRLPRPLAAELAAKWEARRRDMVKSGAIETLLRGKGRPFLIFDTVDQQPLGRAFYWPDSLPAGQDEWMQCTLKVECLADDEAALLSMSYDGGRTWVGVSWNRYQKAFFVSLPRVPEKWFMRDFRLRLELPGGDKAVEWKHLPPIRYPEK